MTILLLATHATNIVLMARFHLTWRNHGDTVA